MFDVAAFYCFCPLHGLAGLQGNLARLCAAERLCGTILLAGEGVNGTVAGSAAGIARLRRRLEALVAPAVPSWSVSTASAPPFGRMKVRIKTEIVTLGQPEVDPARCVGQHVAATEWNRLISDPDVAVIDTRNAYEVAIGSFRGAIDPGTARFRDFPAWWRANAPALAGRPVAMFCTGGIRCEKATSWLLGTGGASEVYHLRGGILSYLRDVPPAQSLWQGGCFVFDGRVALGHGLEPTGHLLCHGCRAPLSPSDRDRPQFEQGVCCHLCAPRRTEAEKARLRERNRQIELARERGQPHLGARS